MVHNPEEFQAGLFARDTGIARAERGASADWMKDAERAVYDLAHRVEKFTSEDVRDLLRTWAIPEPTEVRALGGVMRRVAPGRGGRGDRDDGGDSPVHPAVPAHWHVLCVAVQALSEGAVSAGRRAIILGSEG